MSDTQSPSARIIAAAQATRTLTDADGRKIVFRPLNVLEQARLFKAIGSQDAENAPFLRLATVAASVVEIDGVPCPPPRTPQQVEAAIGRLGDSGFLAVQVEAERIAREAEDAARAAAE